jgi:Rha family phage regulatory protein
MNTQVQATDYTSFVFEKNDDIKTDSFKIADKFSKLHKNVIRDIEKIISSFEELLSTNTLSSDDFTKLRFELCFKNNELQNGKPQKFYELNESAFMLVVMAYTGIDAMAIKIRYINAFNFMRDSLSKPPYGLKEIPHQAYCPTVLTEKMCGHIQERVNELSRIEGVHYNTKYRELKDEFRCNTYTELPVTKYADICVFLDCLPIYPIPEYIMIEGNELREMRIARRELEDFKANPALLPCGENELWTKCTNDDVIIPYSQFEQMNALIESHQSAKDSITQSIKQAFDEIDTTSDNILVGRQRWNELNFIVKKVMNNPQALAIL